MTKWPDRWGDEMSLEERINAWEHWYKSTVIIGHNGEFSTTRELLHDLIADRNRLKDAHLQALGYLRAVADTSEQRLHGLEAFLDKQQMEVP